MTVIRDLHVGVQERNKHTVHYATIHHNDSRNFTKILNDSSSVQLDSKMSTVISKRENRSIS
jgi:hypothetical protein